MNFCEWLSVWQSWIMCCAKPVSISRMLYSGVSFLRSILRVFAWSPSSPSRDLFSSTSTRIYPTWGWDVSYFSWAFDCAFSWPSIDGCSMICYSMTRWSMLTKGCCGVESECCGCIFRSIGSRQLASIWWWPFSLVQVLGDCYGYRYRSCQVVESCLIVPVLPFMPTGHSLPFWSRSMTTRLLLCSFTVCWICCSYLLEIEVVVIDTMLSLILSVLRLWAGATLFG